MALTIYDQVCQHKLHNPIMEYSINNSKVYIKIITLTFSKEGEIIATA